MNQLTIRGFDPELLRRIKHLAEVEGLSLNQSALKLMRRGAGLELEVKSYAIGSALDKYAGVWTEDEAREFAAATRSFGEVDEEMWR